MKRRDALKSTGLVLGYSLSAGTIAAVMNGCKAPTETGWMPTTLDKGSVDLIAEIAETILPATDTPGAKDVLVHRFVDEAITKALRPNQKAHIIKGIKGLGPMIKDLTGSSFMDMNAEERLAAVIKLEDTADAFNKDFYAKQRAKNEAENAGKEPERAGPMVDIEATEFRHFYSDLKGLITAGYFTSEKVGKEVLAYDPIPGGYDPCMEMTSDQNAWTL